MERKQPVVIGTDAKGELVWGFIPMPLWQQAMFPARYVGDFLAFWVKQAFFNKTGHEADRDIPNMELRNGHYRSKHPRLHHKGD